MDIIALAREEKKEAEADETVEVKPKIIVPTKVPTYLLTTESTVNKKDNSVNKSELTRLLKDAGDRKARSHIIKIG